ncbi:hypothetical protein PCANC_23936 [Puccinia coronata f. sp. avenae]|uniref:Uncharacterized protein n=1 Tax=Puccinia coronata f. sp. avenae TaxID=200324 RepID=A0A2N5S742_9BASI|nr:hypothetical protein PCANC_23936 [Puccinia coronata f. sp. avenae]
MRGQRTACAAHRPVRPPQADVQLTFTLQKGLYRLQPPAVTSARGDRCYIGRPDRFYTDVTSVAATDLAAGGCNRYNPFGGNAPVATPNHPPMSDLWPPLTTPYVGAPEPA